MKVILISGKAQHGKTTTAEILEKNIVQAGHRAVQINYADYVKFVCGKYYDWDGKKDTRGRHILQYVGTEIFRARDEHFWVDTVIRFAKAASPDYDFMLVGDWRFPNEYTRWAESGFNDVVRIRVRRPEFDNGLTQEQNNHPSELALDNFSMDYELSATDLTSLEQECFRVLQDLNIGGC